MPSTPFTRCCNHVYQLPQDVRKFIEEAVIPAIEAQCKDNPAAEPKHYRVILYPFTRIMRWLITFERMNQTHDMQAIGSGARCIFEHYLDLKWLQTFPDEIWYDRFRAFPEVDRYMAAKKVLDHRIANPASKIDVTPHEQLVKQMDANELVSAKVLRIWGTDEKRRPRWPHDHWTGERSLRARAKRIGPEFEDIYVQIYPTLCAMVHSGPTAEFGEFAWLEKQVAFGYFYAFVHAKAATIVVCDLLGIRQRVERFDYHMQQMDEWAEEAMRNLAGE